MKKNRQDQDAKGYTTAVLKRFGLLLIPTAALTLAGASIVFAQQRDLERSPIAIVAPQATPQPFTDTPRPGSGQPTPSNPGNNPSRDNPPQANNPPVDNPPGSSSPTNDLPANSPQVPNPAANLPVTVTKMNAVPPEMRPAPEAKPVPSAPNLAAMTAVPPEMRPVQEAVPAPSRGQPRGEGADPTQQTATVLPDVANRPVPEAKPAPSASNLSAMTAVPPSMLPVAEPKPAPSN